MIKPAVPVTFLNDLKAINPGLMLIWNESIERFQVFWKDNRNAKVRLIHTIEDDDGSYLSPDVRAINFIRRDVAWNILEKYPEPNDMAKYFREKNKAKLLKAKELREEYRKWWNKEHRKEWKEALENAQRGIFSAPERVERKIILTPY